MNWLDMLKEHSDVLKASESLAPKVEEVATFLKGILDSHGKIILCGNGGSFAHAQHFAAELVVRYRTNREPMRAVALGSNPAISTAVCNDLDPTDIFLREFGAVLDVNDCLCVFSTSGKSKNVIRAIELARAVGMKTIALTGMHGMAVPVDYEIRIPSEKTSVIQQVHTILIHALCELLNA